LPQIYSPHFQRSQGPIFKKKILRSVLRLYLEYVWGNLPVSSHCVISEVEVSGEIKLRLTKMRIYIIFYHFPSVNMHYGCIIVCCTVLVKFCGTAVDGWCKLIKVQVYDQGRINHWVSCAMAWGPHWGPELSALMTRCTLTVWLMPCEFYFEALLSHCRDENVHSLG